MKSERRKIAPRGRCGCSRCGLGSGDRATLREALVNSLMRRPNCAAPARRTSTLAPRSGAATSSPGAIGEGLPFEREFGYFAQGVDGSTSILGVGEGARRPDNVFRLDPGHGCLSYSR